jgi:hypothetical protein
MRKDSNITEMDMMVIISMLIWRKQQEIFKLALMGPF